MTIDKKIEPRPRRVDLRTVIHGAIEATRPLIDARAHTLSVAIPDHPLWADADPARIGQVISNLVNNAATYTEPGGRISVDAGAAGPLAEVAVSDSGIGIPPEMLPRILDMFMQLEPHCDRTPGGPGIGLSLARRLVTLHGGTIDAASARPGHGSTFNVRLPTAAAAADEARLADRNVLTPSDCRVLIAEDNRDAAEMMQVMLQIKGHDVRVASDGGEAVAIAATFRPHIAFLDIGMPVMDGYEAARRIRDTLGGDVVLVALTGWGQDEDKHRSRDAGFDHHLTKPPALEMIERLIADCGRRR